ncbi:Clp protease N-terminal domain-containing protein [Angustibacter sp. McL0619]|uniref:Clp protease N-terminal domain-containing protein n=1 Tax=Angustibacter sp. McL0619 TaxID=3415676 RepID=UPI003CF2CBC3
MFERFTNRARAVVVQAQQEAREQLAPAIGAEHLLLGLLPDDQSLAMRTLTELGVGPAQVREAVERHCASGAGLLDDGDVEALRAIGIDAAEVLRRAEAELGVLPSAGAPTKWRLRMTAEAKKTLELSLREAVALKHKYIGTEHLLLGLLRGASGGLAEVFADLGVTHDQVREVVLATLRRTG